MHLCDIIPFLNTVGLYLEYIFSILNLRLYTFNVLRVNGFLCAIYYVPQ